MSQIDYLPTNPHLHGGTSSQDIITPTRQGGFEKSRGGWRNGSGAGSWLPRSPFNATAWTFGSIGPASSCRPVRRWPCASSSRMRGSLPC